MFWCWFTLTSLFQAMSIDKMGDHSDAGDYDHHLGTRITRGELQRSEPLRRVHHHVVHAWILPHDLQMSCRSRGWLSDSFVRSQNYLIILWSVRALVTGSKYNRRNLLLPLRHGFVQVGIVHQQHPDKGHAGQPDHARIDRQTPRFSVVHYEYRIGSVYELHVHR